ncbi:MAG: hypothetical protein Q4E83_03730 [bacterium]|nr:hypothetical protein [bacterium]
MSEIVNFLSRVLTTPPAIHTNEIRRPSTGNSSNNPFASSNPFITSSNGNRFANYGQNRPVIGGYFAGYYNNQPNIVGRRLFIEA